MQTEFHEPICDPSCGESGSPPRRWETLLVGCFGRLGRRARYLKEVDAEEVTLRFWQEIYDEQGKLVELHEKYPVDKGHRKV
ncbi:MAG TPA: hypothetical protein VGB27_17505 [Candidatus Binatia bacterium]